MHSRKMRYTDAQVVLFPYFYNGNEFVMYTKDTLLTEFPLYVINRLKSFAEFGSADVHWVPITPLFFVSESYEQPMWKELCGTDTFSSFSHIIKNKKEKRKFWIFGPPCILEGINIALAANDVDAFLYERNEEDHITMCSFSFKKTENGYVPVIKEWLFEEGICGNN